MTPFWYDKNGRSHSPKSLCDDFGSSIHRLPVNNRSITSMSVVHFLHQTDIGLALRKHQAIYRIPPTLFSPSHSLPLDHSHLFAFQLRKQESGVKCIRLFSFSSYNLSLKFLFLFPLFPFLLFNAAFQLCLSLSHLNLFVHLLLTS